jgi:hypothetical protein
VCRVLGTPGELRIFRRRELALERVQQSVEDLPLPIVERLSSMLFPEPRLVPGTPYLIPTLVPGTPYLIPT